MSKNKNIHCYLAKKQWTRRHPLSEVNDILVQKRQSKIYEINCLPIGTDEK